MPLSAKRLQELEKQQQQQQNAQVDLRTQSGSSSSLSGGNIDINVQPWAEHYPFPTFEKASGDKSPSQHSPARGGDNSNRSPGGARRRTQFRDDTSDSSDDTTVVPQARPHKLSSDWNLEPLHAMQRPGSAASLNTSPTLSRHGSISPQKGTASFRNLLKRHQKNTETRFSTATVTKDDLTSLVSIFDPSNPLGDTVDQKHMDIKWIAGRLPHSRRIGVKPPLVPPALHLNLGNLPNVIDGPIRERQVLINSPRSAIILMRNGISMNELKRDQSEIQAKQFVPLSKLSHEERKKLNIEKVRQQKLQSLVAEYESVCEKVSFDEIMYFCNQYDSARPSSASLVDLSISQMDNNYGGGWDSFDDRSRSRTRSSLAAAIGRPSTAMSTTSILTSNSNSMGSSNDSNGRRMRHSPEEQARERYEVLMDKYDHREERIVRSSYLLNRAQEEEREKIVKRIVSASGRAQSAKDQRTQQSHMKQQISQAKGELWTEQRQRHLRVENFRRLVLRERVNRRLDEVNCVQKGMRDTIQHFRDSVWRRNVERVARKENEATMFMKLAKKRFLETQF